MDNNYPLPPDAWTFIDFENKQQPELDLEPEPYFNTDSMLLEPEVDWDRWMDESGLLPEQLFGNVNLGGTAIQAVGAYADPMQSMDAWPSEASAYSNPVANELEQILFSSPESSQMAYTSTPTPTPPSCSHNHSSPTTSPTVSSITSSPTNTSAQAPTSLYPCPSCPKSFPKRHLLNRHFKQHNPQITCPHRCGHATARNRDMGRHILAHHQQRTAPHKCPVKGCVSARDGFTRKDNLTRHMKKVHGRLRA